MGSSQCHCPSFHKVGAVVELEHSEIGGSVLQTQWSSSQQVKFFYTGGTMHARVNAWQWSVCSQAMRTTFLIQKV